MKLLGAIASELIGLFVDDGYMALAIIGLVAIVAGLTLVGAPSLATGPALLLGCLAILGHSVLRVGRR